MSKTCSKCGHIAEEGEMFVTFVDPKKNWWLHLFGNQYCNKCAALRRRRDRRKQRRQNETAM